MDNYYKIIADLVDYSEVQLDEIKFIAVNEFGACGVEEYAMEEAEVDNILGKRAYSGGDLPESVLDEVDNSQKKQSFKFYFSKENAEDSSLNFSLYLDKNKITHKRLRLPNMDWNEAWKSSYKRIDISNTLSVIPAWEKISIEPHEIYINPGMGFGTGSHETTYLCLKNYLEISKNEINDCLDLGCGSGILGIAAIKIDNLNVDFCDIDKNALDNCVENLTLNFPQHDLSKCCVLLRDRYTAKKYDLVFANILEHILIEESTIIENSTRLGGILIVSGILIDQVESIQKCYIELGFTVLSVDQKNDWASIVFQKEK